MPQIRILRRPLDPRGRMLVPVVQQIRQRPDIARLKQRVVAAREEPRRASVRVADDGHKSAADRLGTGNRFNLYDSAAAMAAAALVQMLGGTPEQALDASSIALSNLLGLVCDPVGGLVEVPCQNRNAIGVAAAFSSAQLALAGIKSLVPFDQMAHVMLSVGHALPATLRETAKGGVAQAPAALSACAKCGICG